MKAAKFLLALMTSTAAVAATAAPELSQVTAEVVARSGAVKITYSLDKDAVVTLDDVLVGGVSIGPSNVTKVVGACHRKIKAGAGREIYWFPKKERAELEVGGAITAQLTAHDPATPPDYMLFELRPYQAANNWTYSTEFTCTNMAYSTRFYASAANLPDGGLKNIRDYYTRYLVMRKIPAKNVTWRMGYRKLSPNNEHGGTSQKTNAAPHYVKLTSDYYMGIYPVTFGQEIAVLTDLATKPRTDYFSLAESLTGEKWDDLKWGLPYGGINAGILVNNSRTPKNRQIDNLRGGSAYYWPTGGHDVKTGTAIELYRRVMKLPVDLPTEAQWEFAARAGTDCPFGINGGIDNAWPTTKTPGGVTTTNVMVWCRQTTEMKPVYKDTGAVDWNASAYYAMPCGLHPSNNWGLYDMHGNAWEWCLDRYHYAWTSETDNWYLSDASTASRETYADKPVVVDPIGPSAFVSDKDGYFCLRGGSAGNGQENGICNFRYFANGSTSVNAIRLTCPVPTL